MSLCTQGFTEKISGGKVTIQVEDSDPLIILGNLIDWTYLMELIKPDLKRTEKGCWWLGRKLRVRIHLAVLMLQMLFKWTDRETERLIKTSAMYQIFSGIHIISRWSCPDHTKIETFRNRLSEGTYKKIADYIVQLAVSIGLADSSKVDIDSTVQEANVSYPSDANLMRRLSDKCYKLLEYLKSKGTDYLPQMPTIDIKKISEQAKKYFFLSKNTCMKKKQEVFSAYHSLVSNQLMPFIKLLQELPAEVLQKLPWNYRQAAVTIKQKASGYLSDVAHFVKTNTLEKGKILSLKLKDIICIKKGKLGKAFEFGRVFQVGRIGGNFMVPYTNTSLRMEDKKSLIPIIKEHQQIFGPGVLQSVTTDKGYYSRANVKYVEECTGNADGIQRPANIKDQVQGPQKQELYNRRAGVEPLIGHIKRFGLGKSKMKSDRATLSSGYRSISGFNLHQLMRGITKNMKIQGLDGTTLTSNLTSISGFNPHQMKAQGTI